MSDLKIKKIGQSGEASQGRVCYQRGLPRLVFFVADILNFDANKRMWQWQWVETVVLARP